MLQQGIAACDDLISSMPDLEREVAIGTVEIVAAVVDPADAFDCFTQKQPVVDHRLVTKRRARPVSLLLRPRAPVESHGSYAPAARSLTLETTCAVGKRVRMNDEIITDQADVAAFGALKMQNS